MLERVRAIGAEQSFARHLGIEFISAEPDRAVLRLPYNDFLGDDRVNGGAISALVDLAATCAFWAQEGLGGDARGATVGFSISYLELVVEQALTASARVRRRGGRICVGDVSVRDEGGREVAIAQVTYKLKPGH